MNVFSKASAGLNLTPGERAFVKLVEGFLVAGALSAATVLITAASNPHPDWATVAKLAAFAFATAALLAASKYYKAQGDAPLADALARAAAGVSDYGNKPAIPVVQNAPAPVSVAATVKAAGKGAV